MYPIRLQQSFSRQYANLRPSLTPDITVKALRFCSLLNRNGRKFVAAFIILLATSQVNAQTKSSESFGQVWLGYFNQTRLSNKWGIWAEAQIRTKEDLFTNFSTGFGRVGLTYYLTDDVKLTAGYAYVNHFPADNHAKISRPEHRVWQQIQWHTKYPKLRLMQWFRLEERYRRKVLDEDDLAEGYNFNYRIRYNIFSQFPLSKKRFQPKTFWLIVNNEVHINFGKQIVNNYFDQNRFFLGMGYQVNASDNVQFGYMNLFQQLAAGNQYRTIHAARIGYSHNLDLRKGSR